MPTSRVSPWNLRRWLVAATGVAAAVLGGTVETENAVANGDTRTLTIYHTHTQESATITFKRDGHYDRAALDQLNWLLRDWRINEPIKMDPRLFDTVWEAYRQVGSSQPINIVSAYRSPGTNAMLRRRSKMVAEYSQHMLGKAMDFYLPDVPIDRIREVGFIMSRGGVGWYPRANTPFIHMDVGSVRSWPRMTHDQLARIFPDGKTVHLPADGHPMARYEEAKAEILSRGGTVAGITTQLASGEDEDGPSLMGFLAGLFGGSRPEPAPAPAPAMAGRKGRPAPVVAVASADAEDTSGAKAVLAYAAPVAAPPADARAMLTAEPAAPMAVAEGGLPSVVAPLPPRRPSESAIVAAAAIAMPLPPPRPVLLAALDGGMAHLAAPAPAPAPILMPASGAPAPRATLVGPNADSKAQLRALFEAVAIGSGTGRNVPVHMATARTMPGAPAGAVSATPGAVTTRFARDVPDDARLGARFTGPAAVRLRQGQ
ncbi:DUF882 domain-containing protein [Methylobacterium sp. J-076]|nr:DUF882 domain-containing protein [Methylobacterium sp. J-076]MCJ2012948.1 DUF882 domain-containing protein [Methylobacterium sp. J-076]